MGFFNTIGTMKDGPRILAIDTSGRLGSVVVARGSEVVGSTTFKTDHNHASELMPTIQTMWSHAGWKPGQIDQMYLSIGPGSFTGLRIAVALARTLALSTGCRLVSVPTLEVIAQNALTCDPAPPTVGVVLDAKRSQVYAATYVLSGRRYEQDISPEVISPDSLRERLTEPRHIMGEGIRFHSSCFQAPDFHVIDEGNWRAKAETVHQLGYHRAQAGQFDDARMLVPVYLRMPEAEEKWQRDRGLSQA